MPAQPVPSSPALVKPAAKAAPTASTRPALGRRDAAPALLARPGEARGKRARRTDVPHVVMATIVELDRPLAVPALPACMACAQAPGRLPRAALPVPQAPIRTAVGLAAASPAPRASTPPAIPPPRARAVRQAPRAPRRCPAPAQPRPVRLAPMGTTRHRVARLAV
jgi:hypothetical protein